MLFVENCDYIEPLLEKIAAEGIFKDDIARILLLYQTFQQNKDQMIQQYFTQKKAKLTQREIEIARLAASGVTNNKIGMQLYISANTVKAAIKSIYAKLSINNRTLLQQHLDDLGL